MADQLRRESLPARCGAARCGASRLGFVTPDVANKTVDAPPIVYVHHDANPEPATEPGFTEVLS
jgi:hypothetical protein